MFTDSFNAATPFLMSTVQITVVRSNGCSHHSHGKYNLKVSVRLARSRLLTFDDARGFQALGR